MTISEQSGRSDRRPPWLQQKYSKAPADPKLADACDKIIAILAADLGAGRSRARVLSAPDDERARQIKNALYDAAYKRWNPARPEQQISLSANVIDPADGLCKARGAERCSQNGCTPTPGKNGIHARAHPKADGRAHQGTKPRDTWDYDPMTPRKSRQPAGAPPPATDPGPGKRFGADQRGPARPDPASHIGGGIFDRSPGRSGKTAGTRSQPGKTGNTQPKTSEPPQDSILSRIRRTLG